MGKDKATQVVTVDTPGMTNVVTREYLQIWGSDIMINRKFFKWWTLFLAGFFGLGTYIATRVVQLDMLIYAWFTANLWILLPFIGTGVVAAFVWKHNVEREARQLAAKAKERLAYAEKYIDKNLPEVD